MGKIVVHRTYFRIQGKRLPCSKRASYLGNTSWPGSPKLMKVYTPLWCITLFTISYFLSNILRITDNGRNRNSEDFSLILFPGNSRYHHWILKPTEKIFKEFCKGFPTMVGQRRKVCFPEPLKHFFHHSVNTFFWKR